MRKLTAAETAALIVIPVALGAVIISGIIRPKEKPPISSADLSAFEHSITDPQQALAKLKDGSVIMITPEPLSLSEGKATATTDNTFPKGTVFTLNKILGSKKTTNGYDIFAEIVINPGGSGTFHSVAIFHISPEAEYLIHTLPTCRSLRILGDRIIINSASVSDDGPDGYKLTVEYLDRKLTDPMVAPPTEKRTKTFNVSNSSLSE